MTVNVSNGDNVELMATESKYNSRFQSFKMSDDGNGAYETAGDGEFSAYLPFRRYRGEVKFFIRA